MIAMESQKTGSPEFSLAAHFNCHGYRKQALTHIISHSVVVITGTVIPGYAIRVRGLTWQLPKFGAALL